MQTLMPATRSLEHLGELYHDYTVFGASNKQLQNFVVNQKCKQPILTSYISYAIAKSQETFESKVSFLEMFCADGFFAMLARTLGATESYGLDTNKDGWSSKAEEIVKGLGLTNVSFIWDDVHNLSKHGQFDVVANIGGLYHISDPEEVLLDSYRAARKYLIVQNVVQMNNNDPNFFKTPAPEWTWGSRYSRASFDKLIRKHKFNVVDQHFNILEGNEKPHDRGSAYYLIKKEPARKRWF